MPNVSGRSCVKRLKPNTNWATGVRPAGSAGALVQVLAGYPESNRPDCACVYLGQMSQGPEAVRYYKLAIEKYSDCWWGDGTQVGPAARYLLAQELRKAGQTAEAQRLEKDALTRYPDAVWHSGHSLADELTAGVAPGNAQRWGAPAVTGGQATAPSSDARRFTLRTARPECAAVPLVAVADEDGTRRPRPRFAAVSLAGNAASPTTGRCFTRRSSCPSAPIASGGCPG